MCIFTYSSLGNLRRLLTLTSPYRTPVLPPREWFPQCSVTPCNQSQQCTQWGSQGAASGAMVGSPKKTAYTPNTCAMTPFHSGGYSAPMAGESPAFKPAPSGKRLNCRIMTSQSSTGNGGWGSRAAHQLNTPREIRETECES